MTALIVVGAGTFFLSAFSGITPIPPNRAIMQDYYQRLHALFGRFENLYIEYFMI